MPEEQKQPICGYCGDPITIDSLQDKEGHYIGCVQDEDGTPYHMGTGKSPITILTPAEARKVPEMNRTCAFSVIGKKITFYQRV